jgi:hypothetical protein
MAKSNSTSLNDLSVGCDYECCTNSGCSAFQQEINEKFKNIEVNFGNKFFF